MFVVPPSCERPFARPPLTVRSPDAAVPVALALAVVYVGTCLFLEHRLVSPLRALRALGLVSPLVAVVPVRVSWLLVRHLISPCLVPPVVVCVAV